MGRTPSTSPDPLAGGPGSGDGLPTDGPADAGAWGDLVTGTEHPFAWVDHRDVHQATGVITEQGGIGAAAALAWLRAVAFGSGRELADVLARRLRFHPLDRAEGSDENGEGRDRDVS
ncbi:hypothetical protein [Pseudonocardia xishanensis]|uniref:ANTAR domain-containing protein n=1 Tax=Pseudonocardia xishanensis TaxID=630995 RepID=A0ABP8RQ91_9PSEU